MSSEPSQAPVAFQAIDLSYEALSDRISLTCRGQDSQRRFALTRRMLREILVNITDLLSKTSAAAAAAPADQRDAVLIFEHLDAAAGLPAPAASGASAATPASVPAQEEEVQLLVKLDITLRGQGFEFLLWGKKDAEGAAVTLSRSDVHRLVSILYRTASAASWDLEGKVGWVGELTSAGMPLAPASAVRH